MKISPTAFSMLVLLVLGPSLATAAETVILVSLMATSARSPLTQVLRRHLNPPNVGV